VIHPQFEVDRLKQTLIFKGLSESEANELSTLAMQDISEAMNSLAFDAASQAAEAGMSMGAEKFVEQIQIIDVGGIFKVATSSGKTDFSLPPFPMLPRLLKNAKVAKDGSLYRVIPVGSKSASRKRNLTTLSDVQQDINKQHVVDLETRKQILKEARSISLTGGSSAFSGLQKAQQLLSRNRQTAKKAEAPAAGHTTFRTASSKQDPNQKWVLPEKKLNMRVILDDINRQLEVEIQHMVQDVVNSYEELA